MTCARPTTSARRARNWGNRSSTWSVWLATRPRAACSAARAPSRRSASPPAWRTRSAALSPASGTRDRPVTARAPAPRPLGVQGRSEAHQAGTASAQTRATACALASAMRSLGRFAAGRRGPSRAYQDSSRDRATRGRRSDPGRCQRQAPRRCLRDTGEPVDRQLGTALERQRAEKLGLTSDTASQAKIPWDLAVVGLGRSAYLRLRGRKTAMPRWDFIFAQSLMRVIDRRRAWRRAVRSDNWWPPLQSSTWNVHLSFSGWSPTRASRRSRRSSAASSPDTGLCTGTGRGGRRQCSRDPTCAMRDNRTHAVTAASTNHRHHRVRHSGSGGFCYLNTMWAS